MLGKNLITAAAGNAAPPPIGGNYWAAYLGTLSVNVLAYSGDVDSEGNVYVCGLEGLVAKYDIDGNLVWQKYYRSTTNDAHYAVHVDADDNIFIGGSIKTATRHASLTKIDPNGNVLNSIGINDSAQAANYDDYIKAIVTDSSGNIYICGETTSPTGASFDIFVSKLDSNLNILWSRDLLTNNAEYGHSIALDSNNNIYISGYENSGAALLAKYNNSGTLQWQKIFSSTGSYEEFRQVAIDSNDNIYVATRNNSYYYTIFKLNTSGTILAQRTDSSTTAGNIWISITDTDDVMTATYAWDGSANQVHIHKFDSSLNLQWTRKLSTPASKQVYWSTCDRSGNFYIFGSINVSSYNHYMTVKLRPDGTVIGTFGNWTYSTPSSSISTPNWTFTNGGLTSTTGGMTSNVYFYPTPTTASRTNNTTTM